MIKYFTQPQQEHLLPPPSSLFLWPIALSEPFKQSTTGLSALIEKHTNAPSLFLHSALGSKISDHRLVVQPPPPTPLQRCTLMLRQSEKTQKQTNRRGEEEVRRRGVDCWRSPRVSFLLAAALAAVNGGLAVSFCCCAGGLSGCISSLCLRV